LRFIELIPVKNLTAELAADALIQIIGRYGISNEIMERNLQAIYFLSYLKFS
jgi:hypothetical protein